MSRDAPTLFLRRDGYKRRRMRDLARVLPAAGVFLFTLPLLWSLGDEPPASTSLGLIYLFVVWIGLIGVTFFLARRLTYPDSGPGGEGR